MALAFLPSWRYTMAIKGQRKSKSKRTEKKKVSSVGLSDSIADFINELLKDESTAELQRSELANRFNCVPSQINYVISTRFSPERGYVVESRRGGGGYIRITRVRLDPAEIMMHAVNAIGTEIDYRSAAAILGNAVSVGAMTERTARVLLAGISDAALRPVPPEKRDETRASVLKQMLTRLIA